MFFSLFFPLPPLAGEQAAVCQSPAWEFPQQATIVQTYVTGFMLQGKRRSDRLYVSDFDVVITGKEERLVPLFRLLRLLEAVGKYENNQIVFKIGAAPEASIDVNRRLLLAAGKEIPILLKQGNSDVTNLGELYVTESVLKEGFGLDFSWSEQNYEYTIKTEQPMAVLQAHGRQSTSLLLTRVEQELINLTETEPPAKPGESQRLVTFLKPELRGEILRQKVNRQNTVEMYARPALTLWGNVLNGNYRIRLNQNIRTPQPRIPSLYRWIDEGAWSAKHENLLVRVGDSAVGFSELVLPGGTVFGATAKWFPIKAGREAMRDLFFVSRGSRFLSEGVFEGIAQLGATVELWVNNRLIQSKIVAEVIPDKPGYGRYWFESVGLLERSFNNIRIVIKRTDGVVEEYYRRILGTSALLPAGQLAVLSGVGTKRQRTLEDTKVYGFVAGTQVLYGVFPALTLGLTAATQNGYALLLSEGVQDLPQAPRSYHLGQQANLKFLEHFLWREEYAFMYEPNQRRPEKAYKTGLEFYLDNLIVDGQIFFYGPHYMNGMTSIADRQGYFINGNVRLFKTMNLSGLGVHIRNNLDDSQSITRREDVLGLGYSTAGLIPRSTLFLKTYYSQWTDEEKVPPTQKAQTHVVEVESRVTKKLNLEVRRVFGENAVFSAAGRLTYGISIPGIDQLYAFGWQAKVNYRFSERNTVVANYWADTPRRQIELAHYHKYYNEEGRHTWSSRLETGQILPNTQYYGRGYLELNLDEIGNNRLGLKAASENNGEEYYYGLYLSLSNLFYVRERRIKQVRQYGISPELGGIDGVVYLDLNGNGHRELEEPGVGSVDIMVDGRSKTTSDKHGNFFISRIVKKEYVTVSIDVSSLPAIYLPTQGKQKVYWKEGVFTKACLGVCVSNAISGSVKAGSYSGTMHGLSGVRILLMSEDQKTVIKDSITADDGSYFIGEVKPGNYVIDVDFSSFPNVYKPIEPARKIAVLPSLEPHETEHCDFNLIVQK